MFKRENDVPASVGRVAARGRGGHGARGEGVEEVER
jgi:hypothetical protein